MFRLFSIAIIFVLAAAAAFTAPGLHAQSGDMLVYFGTYTGEKSTSKGIYVSRLEGASGVLTAPELVAETANPSYLAVHPAGKWVYAANEVRSFGDKETGSVSAFAVDGATGRLSALNQESSGGRGAVHLIVDKAGHNVLVANYGGGSAAVLPIAPDGALKPATAFVQHTGSGFDKRRQSAPRAHSINLDPGNRFVYVPDLGLDKVMIYRFDGERGTMVANDPPFAQMRPGDGPRHFAFHPEGRFAYVINEMGLTITAFAADPQRGALSEVETVSTLRFGESAQEGFSTADVQVHPSGRFLYGSNRGHDTIVAFEIDRKSGKLRYVEHEPTQGNGPRAFGIDPTGRYLLAANQRSDSVVVFSIDAQTGRLTPTGHKITLGQPACVKFMVPGSDPRTK